MRNIILFLGTLFFNCCFAQTPVISYSTPNIFYLGITVDPLVPTNIGGPVPNTAAYGQVDTFAGSGSQGSLDAIAAMSTFNGPHGLAFDALGNIYIADSANHKIRKISTTGVVSTFAGSGNVGSTDGLDSSASFSSPTGVACDALGNVYVADSSNNKIRKISTSGVVTTIAGNGNIGFADGAGSTASFSNPTGVACDTSGDVYVADRNNNLIRKIDATGVVTTFAGNLTQGMTNGAGNLASFNAPTGVACDTFGNVYVADSSNNKIRKITATGVVSTFAGSGSAGTTNAVGVAASFSTPTGLTVDAIGNVYVTDFATNRIRKITPIGEVTTLAGRSASGAIDEIGNKASFDNPYGLAVTASGIIYVADSANNKIRKLSTTGYTITATLPVGLTFDPITGIISGTPSINRLPTNHIVTAYNSAGTSSTTVNISVVTLTPPNVSYATPQTYTVGTAVAPLTPANTGGAVPAGDYGAITLFAGNGTIGSVNGAGSNASFYDPRGLAADSFGNIYVADLYNHQIRKISPTGFVTSMAGNGFPGSTNGMVTSASFNYPKDVAADNAGNVYVAEYSRIRKISANGLVTTVAGDTSEGSVDGPVSIATFNYPQGVATDETGNIYVADTYNHKIRKITPSGVVSTIAGNGIQGSLDGVGTSASFSYPNDLVVDGTGNIYVTDTNNYKIRKITPSGIVTTLAGSGVIGSTDGNGTAASFNSLIGIVLDSNGNIYVTDPNNQKIRKISATGEVSTLLISGSNSLTRDPTTGNLYISNSDYRIRKITMTGYTISPTLPPGLTFDGTTGIISGTPTTPVTATTYTINAYNAAGSCEITISLAINLPLPIITYPTPQTYTVGTAITPLIPTNSGGAVPATMYGEISVFAGSGYEGSTNDTGTAASFSYPMGLATDIIGNVYVADRYNHQIRKISPAGVVSTLAGTGSAGSTDGLSFNASFNNPMDVAVDGFGNVFVADTYNHKIRKISPTGLVTSVAGYGGIFGSFADGTGSAARFDNPTGIAIDGSGVIYVADSFNNRIRKITSGGVVTTLAGTFSAGSTDGNSTVAQFNSPSGVIADANGNVYIADSYNYKIRKITSGGIVSTLAGNGTPGWSDGNGATASFNYSWDMTSDLSGNIYVGDGNSGTIRKITPTGMVTTLSAGGPQPFGVTIDGFGNLYTVNTQNHRIQKIITTGYTITPNLPPGLIFDSTTGTISGTPTSSSPTTTYTITAFNAMGSSTTTVVITVIYQGTVNLKLLIEGYYDMITDVMRPVKNNQDSISQLNEVEDLTVELRDSQTYTTIASTIANLHTDGTLTAIFDSAPSGAYYIAVKGRNIVQTWSALPQIVSATPLTYDFTTAASQAYGDNMKEVASGVWAFYNGDINQDELIDTQDFVIWEGKYLGAAFGEEPSDLNGDGLVDTQDYTIWEANYLSSVFASYPF